MIAILFPWVLLSFEFGHCRNVCQSPKYFKRQNARVDLSSCMTTFATREVCLNNCFENYSCIAAVFADYGQVPVCCTYYHISDVYYLQGEMTLYYRSGIPICKANQQPPDCSSCLNKYDNTTGCASCLPNYDIKRHCAICVGNYDIRSECTKCIGNYTIASNCSKCLNNYNLATNCTTCKGNFDLTSGCTHCIPRWVGSKCNSCDFGLTGRQCDQCARKVQFTGEYEHYTRGDPRITFTFNFSGPDCTTFTG